MSDLLNKASLVMIPSGYKEDIVYSAIPTDGSGDLSFTRASNGTRINSAGLVEVTPWNLLSNSEQFTSANGWFSTASGGASVTQTSDYGVAPNGTTTADRIQLALNGGTNATWILAPTLPIVVGQVYTYSIYLKSLSGSPTIIFFNDNTANISKTITTDWVRYDYTWTASSATIYPRFTLSTSTSSSADLLAWGYQLNIGSTAKPYFPTTDRLNVPRLTYQNGGGGCPSLLLEKQSTNLLTYSEQFDNAAYSQGAGAGGSITRTANYATSPDGTQNADRLQFTRGTSYAELYQRVATTAGVTYTLSFWAKSLSGTPTLYTAWNGAYANGVTFTTDWVRYTYTFVAAGTSSGLNFITFSSLPTTSTTADILVWGAQMEASSYATSYIPTTSSSATRVADACYKTGISSLIGQTEGTLFADVILPSTHDSGRVLVISGGSNRVGITLSGTTAGFFIVTGGGGVIFSSVAAVTGPNFKMALAYKSGASTLYVNGVSILSTTGAFSFNATVDTIYLGQSELTPGTGQNGQRQSEALLFKNALTTAELISLTTL